MACLSSALSTAPSTVRLSGRSTQCTTPRAAWRGLSAEASTNPLSIRRARSTGAAMFSTRSASMRGPLVVRAASASNSGPDEPESNKRDANPLSGTNNKDSLEERVPSAGLAKTDSNKKGLQRLSPSTGMEIVLHAARNEGEIPAAPEDIPLKSRSPRRTKKLRFTCNRCSQRTEAYVNPHALETGTVFVQCSHCLVQHKVVDNLNLFNDMESPQYQDDSETFYRRGGPASYQADLESLYKMKGFGGWDPSEDVESN